MFFKYILVFLKNKDPIRTFLKGGGPSMYSALTEVSKNCRTFYPSWIIDNIYGAFHGCTTLTVPKVIFEINGGGAFRWSLIQTLFSHLNILKIEKSQTIPFFFLHIIEIKKFNNFPWGLKNIKLVWPENQKNCFILIWTCFKFKCFQNREFSSVFNSEGNTSGFHWRSIGLSSFAVNLVLIKFHPKFTPCFLRIENFVTQ